MTTKKWSAEECELLAVMCKAGYSNADMAVELECSEKAVVMKKHKLGIRTQFEYTKEHLLDILKSASEHTASYFNNPLNRLPTVQRYQRHFGSWNAALKAAGIQVNQKGLKLDKLTTVYLVRFNGYYKAGITQQTVTQRLSGYPSYKICWTKTFETLEPALELEKQILEYVKPYQHIAEDFPRGIGKTECFVMEKFEFAKLLSILYN